MATLLGTVDTTGGSNDFFAQGDAVGTKYTAVASGTLETLSIIVRASNTQVKLAVYADSGGSTQGALLAETGTVSFATSGTFTGNLLSTIAITSGTPYWLMVWVLAAGQLNITGGILNGGYDGHAIGTSGTWPAPWDNTGDGGDPTIGIPIVGEGTVGGASTIPTLVMAPPIPA